jgi:hypothetical protein
VIRSAANPALRIQTAFEPRKSPALSQTNQPHAAMGMLGENLDKHGASGRPAQQRLLDMFFDFMLVEKCRAPH